VSVVYSKKRLRLVLLLLTLVTLPVVLGAAAAIYYYLKYARIVDQRLSGERWLIPSRLYSRPLLLRVGMPLPQARFVKFLNGLKYEEKTDAPAPGQFAVRKDGVLFAPRPGPNAAKEQVLAVFDKDHLLGLRGLPSKQLYATQSLEPELIRTFTTRAARSAASSSTKSCPIT
jgi:penicillin-binding protein 1B